MSKQRQELGKLGEEQAASYLRERGYRLLARNYRCRLGEIDIVAADGDILVFVEVRCRTSGRFGLPQESVQRRKQVRLRRAAQCYLRDAVFAVRANPSGPAFTGRMRFDVLALLFNRDHKLERIEHIKNAF